MTEAIAKKVETEKFYQKKKKKGRQWLHVANIMF